MTIVINMHKTFFNMSFYDYEGVTSVVFSFKSDLSYLATTFLGD